jgi:hypothetical protein
MPAAHTDERGSYIITTVAGYGDQASDGDGAPARSAGLYYPYGVTVDKHDNIYICDTHNSRCAVPWVCFVAVTPTRVAGARRVCVVVVARVRAA